MWANAQRDGRPAQHRWRPLFNAAVWLTPTSRCCAVTLPCSTRNPCPKLLDRYQPLVGQSSTYYEDMWRTYCCLTIFFPIVDMCLKAKFHYASQFGASSELASVMEFGFKHTS